MRRLKPITSFSYIIICIFSSGIANAQAISSFDSALQKIQSMAAGSERLDQLIKIQRNFADITPRQAIKLGNLVLNSAISLNVDTVSMKEYITLGDNYTTINDFPSALKSYFKALEIAGRVKDYEKQAIANDGISWLYKTTGETDNSPADLEKATLYLEKGLDICRKHNLVKRELYLLGDLGIEYDLKKMHTKAIETYHEALAKSAGLKDSRFLFDVYMNMGISFKNNKEFNDALNSYKKAVHIADSVSPGSSFEKMMVFDNMANLYYEMGQLPVSESMALESINLSYANNNDRTRLDMYGLLKKIYEKQGKYKDALNYSMKLADIKDSIFDQEKSLQVKDMQEKYDTDIKDKQITSQQGEIDYNKKLNLILGGSGIALLLIAGFIYYNLRKTARLNRIVLLQRDELSKQSKALSVMMKELHHRVKNNLQIVSSLLNLQSLRLTDEDAINAVTESKQRVQAMSLIHQKLYKAEDITRINMKDYIKELADFLAASYGYGHDNFMLELDIQEEWADIDKALPIGLILNEVLTNAFKYAFAGIEHPILHISFKSDMGNITLEVKDNGKGIKPGEWDANKNTSFGRQLIKALCGQLRAKETLQVANGTNFVFNIPATAA